MERKHRISAGSIVIHDDRILLVRCSDIPGETYLVAPGGGVEIEEGLSQAAVREVKEETGIDVVQEKILCVEDLYWRKYRISKVWFLCRMIGGELERTQGAIDEGIIEAKWYAKDELKNEVVYPQIVAEANWELFFKDTWQTRYLELTYADF
jgi:ADP-ribose pyrophosphatase YjhB (NUDIX family)